MSDCSPDKDSYEIICSKVIEKEINNYKTIFGRNLEIIPYWKESVWEKYTELNSYCKNNYMKNPL